MCISLFWRTSIFDIKKNWIDERLAVVEQKLNIWRAVRMWFSFGLCRLALPVTPFIVPLVPSHGDFLCEVAKKFQVASIPKSSLFWHKLYRFFLFSYWPAHPSLNYSSLVIWGSIVCKCCMNTCWINCNITTSCSVSSEIMQYDFVRRVSIKNYSHIKIILYDLHSYPARECYYHFL